MISLTMLDRRIRSIEDIKAFNNINGSEYKLMNQNGYFGDSIERFSDLRNLQTGHLTNIIDILILALNTMVLQNSVIFYQYTL